LHLSVNLVSWQKHKICVFKFIRHCRHRLGVLSSKSSSPLRITSATVPIL
jgi:hypothetical protein